MKVAFYGRVSTEEQAEKGNIGSQVDFANKYFSLHGEVSGITDFEVYLDDGVSGTLRLQDRPASAQMMTDGSAGKFQAVYVYRLDRLARSTLHVLSAFEFFDSLGIALKSMTESFDTGTSSGKFFMTMLASIAALERDTILERTQLGKERAIKDNRWTSGSPPFGYRVGEDKRLIIEETEAETVRLIFKLYLEGMTTVPIAEYLNARNISTPTTSKGLKNGSGGKWNASHISIILRNNVYAGEYKTMLRSKKHTDGRVIEVPALVGKADLLQADKILLSNLDAGRGSKGRDYLLRGLIFCGNCGRALVGSTGGRKKDKVYYRCTGTTNKGVGKQCDMKMIRAADIEEAIWSDIQGFIANPGVVAEVIEKSLGKEKTVLQPVTRELEEIEKSLLDKQAARQRILSLITKNIISDIEAENQLLTLAGEVNVLSVRREQLHSRLHRGQELSNQAVNVAMILEQIGEMGSEEDRREIIRALVKRITVNTVIEDGKRESEARIEYYFGLYEYGHLRRCSNSYNPVAEGCRVESTWVFKSRSNGKGKRIAML